jgi:hypothetical protein
MSSGWAEAKRWNVSPSPDPSPVPKAASTISASWRATSKTAGRRESTKSPHPLLPITKGIGTWTSLYPLTIFGSISICITRSFPRWFTSSKYSPRP